MHTGQVSKRSRSEVGGVLFWILCLRDSSWKGSLGVWGGISGSRFSGSRVRVRVREKCGCKHMLPRLSRGCCFDNTPKYMRSSIYNRYVDIPGCSLTTLTRSSMWCFGFVVGDWSCSCWWFGCWETITMFVMLSCSSDVVPAFVLLVDVVYVSVAGDGGGLSDCLPDWLWQWLGLGLGLLWDLTLAYQHAFTQMLCFCLFSFVLSRTVLFCSMMSQPRSYVFQRMLLAVYRGRIPIVG